MHVKKEGQTDWQLLFDDLDFFRAETSRYINAISVLDIKTGGCPIAFYVSQIRVAAL